MTAVLVILLRQLQGDTMYSVPIYFIFFSLNILPPRILVVLLYILTLVSVLGDLNFFQFSAFYIAALNLRFIHFCLQLNLTVRSTRALACSVF